jgi:hypothetical protein
MLLKGASQFFARALWGDLVFYGKLLTKAAGCGARYSDAQFFRKINRFAAAERTAKFIFGA